jgi:CheY-like chemotaxis protein
MAVEDGQGTLLIVDDEALVRAAGRRFFTRLGYTVLEAEDGAMALEVFQREQPVGLVLLDVSMPNMDGVETFRRLRELDPELPVILCSGYGLDDRPLEREVKGKATEFVQKPFNMNQLTRTVARLFRAQKKTK